MAGSERRLGHREPSGHIVLAIMRIDPQRLMRLAVLAQHRSFGRAAEQLGLTQPALSQSISQLEREVGVKLLERTPHGAEPTIYGQVLCEHARAIDRELARAAQQIRELAFGHKGALTVGVTAGGAATLVALAICRLHASRSGIDIRITEEASPKPLMTLLRDRAVDLLICQRPPEFELKGTRARSVFQARRVACIRTGHPLTGPVTLRDLSLYPFVCPEEELGILFGFRQIFSTIGLGLPEVLSSNSIHVSKDIVLNSDAFALFSDVSVLSESRLGLLRAIDLHELSQYWMQLILREEQVESETMRSFLGELIEVCKEQGIAGAR